VILETQPALDWSVAQTIKAGTSNEPLVPAVECEYWSIKPMYFRNGWVDATPEIWLRQGVVERLKVAAQALPKGCRLVLLDGWRPKTLQQFLFDSFLENLRKDRPDLSEAEVVNETLNFVAPPSEDPQCPSPHITGGAIDLTLADDAGRIFDMGSDFDETSDRSWTAADVPATAAGRRRVLVEAMYQAGFTNLPSEWWHFDYGNWVWAWYTQQSAAIYGPARLPR